ncbi:MAG: cation diffusion facilitator transporter [Lysobacteraceae bacterium]|nr:MAG: cation diffusion facilitator transporter [Xanthomonadaceae bacterium]
MAGQANSVKSILYALCANFSIFVAKLVAAVITGSGAMLAEAIHSLADTANQVLLLLGLKRSKSPPDNDHPLGYGKTIYFWSFIVAVMLFSMGGLFSLYEAIHKLGDPQPLKSPWIAVGVLVFAIIAEGVSMRACVIEVRKVLAGRSYWRWFRESRQSELVVIFGEDLAALAGLVLALIAVVLTMITGNPLFDALGTAVIGVLLLIIAVLIGNEVRSLLIGQSIDPPIEAEIRSYLQNRAEIAKLHRLVTLQMGSRAMVSVKAEMSDANSAREMVDRINLVERDMRQKFPIIQWLFFEPDIDD